MATSTLVVIAAGTDGISIRTMTLFIASTIAAVIGGYLGYTISNGTHNQKLAAGVITGFVTFVGAYQFLNALVYGGSAGTRAAALPGHVPSWPGRAASPVPTPGPRRALAWYPRSL